MIGGVERSLRRGQTVSGRRAEGVVREGTTKRVGSGGAEGFMEGFWTVEAVWRICEKNDLFGEFSSSLECARVLFSSYDVLSLLNVLVLRTCDIFQIC